MVYAHNSASEDQWLNSDTTAAHSEPDPMGIPQLAESKDGKKASRDIVMFSQQGELDFHGHRHWEICNKFLKLEDEDVPNWSARRQQ